MAMHAPVRVLDEYNLALSAIVIAIWLAIGFFISYKYNYDKGHDRILGTCFIFLAFLLLAMGGSTSQLQIAAFILTILWSNTMILWSRFRDDDGDLTPYTPGTKLWDKIPLACRIAILYTLEGLWVWFNCLPVTVLNSPAVLKHPQPGLPGVPIFLIVIFSLLAAILSFPNNASCYRGAPGRNNPQSSKPMACLRRWGPNCLCELFFELTLLVIFVALENGDGDGPQPNIIGVEGPLYNLEKVILAWLFFIMMWFVLEASVATKDDKNSAED